MWKKMNMILGICNGISELLMQGKLSGMVCNGHKK